MLTYNSIVNEVYRSAPMFKELTTQNLMNAGWNDLFIVSHVIAGGLAAGVACRVMGQEPPLGLFAKNDKVKYFYSCFSKSVACAAGVAATIYLNHSTQALYFTADKAFKIFTVVAGASAVLAVIIKNEVVCLVGTAIGTGALVGYFGQDALVVLGTITALFIVTCAD